MKKTIVLTVLFTLLLLLPVSALLDDGEDCLNDDECESDICQGGECRTIDIINLLEDPEDEDFTETCIEIWTCSEWSVCRNQQQTRICTDSEDCNNYPPLVPKKAETQTCTSLTQPTCTDGIRNQGETGIDCGGPCNVCATCFDNKKNCHEGICEEELDCGGPCSPCIVKEAGESSTFWIIFTTILIIIILLLIGLWYFKLKKGAENIGVKVNNITRRPPGYPGKRPPKQPSSLLRI